MSADSINYLSYRVPTVQPLVLLPVSREFSRWISSLIFQPRTWIYYFSLVNSMCYTEAECHDLLR